MTELEHAIKHIKTRADAWAVKEVTEALQSISERLDKALSQEPCDDVVSRQAVLDLATTIQTDDYSGNEILEVIDVDDVKDLPPVTQKSGKWLVDLQTATEDYYVCSECRRRVHLLYPDDIVNYRFCPNCGARMESEDE